MQIHLNTYNKRKKILKTLIYRQSDKRPHLQYNYEVMFSLNTKKLYIYLCEEFNFHHSLVQTGKKNIYYRKYTNALKYLFLMESTI